MHIVDLYNNIKYELVSTSNVVGSINIVSSRTYIKESAGYISFRSEWDLGPQIVLTTRTVATVTT